VKKPQVHPRSAALVTKAKESLFLIFVTLVLVSPSITSGPLNWLPVVRVTGIDEAPVELGPLTLLPGLALILWALARAVKRPARPWRWGRPGITLPLTGLTLLMLLSLEPTLNRRTALAALTLGLLWWVYLFTVNERPELSIPLALVIVIQGSVALAQFATQADLGLNALMGESSLDPEVSGTCVLFAQGQRWLRAYGLSGHPNQLGALLAVLLLLLIEDVIQSRGWAQAWFTLVASIGLLGLLTTFSRAGWLAFGVGLSGWLLSRLIHRHRQRDAVERSPLLELAQGWRHHAPLLVPVVLALLFLLLHLDLVTSRFLHLDTPIEARSFTDRQVDANLALALIRKHPWRGVGIRNYLVAIRAIEPDSRVVHNVLLLAAAELGLPGAALWLWLSLTGLSRPLSPAWAPWVAMLIAGLFDVALFPINNWHATIAFGLLAGQVSLPRSTAQDPSVVDQTSLKSDDRSSVPIMLGKAPGKSDEVDRP